MSNSSVQLHNSLQQEPFSIWLKPSMSVYVCVSLSISGQLHGYLCLYVCWYLCVCVHLCVHILPSRPLFVGVYVCLFVCLSTYYPHSHCLSVCLCVCLFVCLSVHVPYTCRHRCHYTVCLMFHQRRRLRSRRRRVHQPTSTQTLTTDFCFPCG